MNNIDTLVLRFLEDGPKHDFEIIRALNISVKDWIECRDRLFKRNVRCFENIFFVKEETE
jgi:hypothetical protein